ncbi:4-sulfomuconolactone hydrolase [Macadamia integrifolia]|uniref:4-sulfomuconolactone hydrolase n=1 Tax=Macadamia integrifolia TaxID=60698 RepID=UPI001C4F4FD5|nr:4-sulfomuconolactone hydrolase [Macadamia integrifolia]
MAVSLKPLLSVSTSHFPFFSSLLPKPSSAKLRFRSSATKMAMVGSEKVFHPKIIDSHLHVWASPEEAADKFPYFPGQEPSLPGSVDLLLKCMGEAGVDGALIVQPINHKFDHSLVTSVLKTYPSKFVGCCLANPAEDGNGINQLEHLILKDGYRAVRFNPYLWPSGQRMTNEIGRAMFSKAGELGVPVGFMCMKGLNLHTAEIEELCSAFPSTVVLLDHLAFCKPPINGEEEKAFSALLKLSRFPQVYVKFSALFRVSRKPFPYEDTCQLLSQIVSSYGANRVMWGSDFPFVVPECGYKEAKEAVSLIASQVPLPTSDLEWIMGRTAMLLFQDSWIDS